MNFSLGRSLIFTLALGLALGLNKVSAQTYVATDLTTNSRPVNYTSGQVYGISSLYQAGIGTTTNGASQALLWPGTSTNAVNLTPSSYQSAYANAINGTNSVGQGVTSTGMTNALYWAAPAAPTVINLNPVIGGTAAFSSAATGIANGQQVGYAQPSSTTNTTYAFLWRGSQGTAVNLHPAGYLSSVANATTGFQQAGFATVPGTGYAHAMIWSGSAVGSQDLNPTGFAQSYGTGITTITGSTNSAVAGYAETPAGGSSARAYLWMPSSATATNLHPLGYLNSFATGVASTNVVGYGTTSAGAQVALLWRGYTATNVVNLSASLPSGATNAVATCIDPSGTYIGGYATFGKQTHAVFWQPARAPSITSGAINSSTTVGILFSARITATGLPAPTFSYSTNAPPGLTLSSTGTFLGVPTTSGTYTGTITASNGVSPDATETFALTINPTPVQSYAVEHYFFTLNPNNDGLSPGFGSSLVPGSDGNLYGMTPFGGTGADIPGYSQAGSGIVFRISPGGAYAVLHNFADGSIANDGVMPTGGLVEGADGNYYGMTQNGGAYGFGTVFKITPQGAVTLLHSFAGTSTMPHDGSIPGASMLLASDGNFYGTTIYGGSAANGTLFRISPSGVYTVLHNFKDGSVTNDGTQPSAALIQSSDGNLYGTTASGGSAGFGTLYQLTLQGGYTQLRSFGDGSYAADPEYPSALVEGTDHNFYGTATRSNHYATEVAFKMTTQGAPTILHVFGDGSVYDDGASSGVTPPAGLILGSDGNFYGTTTWGGQPPVTGSGVAFQMTPAGAISILHSFFNGMVANDGVDPNAPLCQGLDGNLYGTTTYGGTTGGGTAFQIGLIGGQTNSIAITSTAPANLIAGTAISFNFSAQGAPQPTFSLTAGTLPPGLMLSNGILSGTPTQPGTYTFTITASNGSSSPVSQTVTLTVESGPTDTPVMPPWGLAMLAALLVVAAIFKPRVQT